MNILKNLDKGSKDLKTKYTKEQLDSNMKKDIQVENNQL